MDTSTKILIADENAAQRQSLANELRRAGFRNVEEAGNGEEAAGNFLPPPYSEALSGLESSMMTAEMKKRRLK